MNIFGCKTTFFFLPFPEQSNSPEVLWKASSDSRRDLGSCCQTETWGKMNVRKLCVKFTVETGVCNNSCKPENKTKLTCNLDCFSPCSWLWLQKPGLHAPQTRSSCGWGAAGSCGDRGRRSEAPVPWPHWRGENCTLAVNPVLPALPVERDTVSESLRRFWSGRLSLSTSFCVKHWRFSLHQIFNSAAQMKAERKQQTNKQSHMETQLQNNTARLQAAAQTVCCEVQHVGSAGSFRRLLVATVTSGSRS